MRIVQPHLNSCFTQTHSQHTTFPSPLPNKISLRAKLRCNTGRAKSQPGWGPGSRSSPVSYGVLRHMAIPCSNFRLTRASRISAWADFSPSPQLVGPIVEATKINQKQNTETGTLKKPSYKLNTGSSNRTSTVPKWLHHPCIGMTGSRKPAAKASATGASASKAAVGTRATRWSQ